MFSFKHRPVLLREAIELLLPKPGGVFVDATVGGGGHAASICEAIGEEGTLIGIDSDADALGAAKDRLTEYSCRVELIKGNFREAYNIVRTLGINDVDGIIFDLGFSSYQVDSPTRGFSYQQDVYLDMRMDTSLAKTAADLLNELSVEELTRVLKVYGEERWASRIAAFIVKSRKVKNIQRSFELVNIIKEAIPARARRKGPHPARRTFQALRIAVNDELGSLKEALSGAAKLLRTGGRICVISYHSLEDRIVKQFFHEGLRGCKCPPEIPICQCNQDSFFSLPVRKAIVPREEEIAENLRARSARLRVAERNMS